MIPESARSRIADTLRAAAPPAIVALAAIILLRFPPRNTASIRNAPSMSCFTFNVPAVEPREPSLPCSTDISPKR